MNLDLFAPPHRGPQISGTTETPNGVEPSDHSGGDEPGESHGVARNRLNIGSLILVALAALSLLGQGERCRIDSRFRSPSATLMTYWEALRANDAEEAFECLVEGRNDLPLPGSLWFLPPTEELWLERFKSLPVTSARILVSYEVHYRPNGLHEERTFRTGSELVRLRGEWHISRPLGEASMPDWKPISRSVDI